MRKEPRRRPRRVGVLVALVVVALQHGVLGLAEAGFSATTARPGSTVVADLLEPVSALTPSRVCTAPAPTFVDSTAADVQATSAQLTKPALAQPGDLLVAVVSHRDMMATPQVPSGWVVLQQGSNLVGRWVVAGRLVTAADPASWTVTGLSLLSRTATTVVAYRGVDPTTSWEASGKWESGLFTSVVAPSVTASTPGTRWVTVYLTYDYTDTLTLPVGTTSRRTISSGLMWGGTRITVGDQGRASTGSTGTATATGTLLSAPVAGVSVLLRSATPTGGVTLTWQPSPDLYATGYEVTRSGSPLGVVAGSTTSMLDATLAPATGATYTVRAVYGTWRSAAVSVPATAC